jgi:hypothetical protein
VTLQDEVDEFVRKADELVNMGETLAWDRITKGADKLVAKDGETPEQRIDRYLRTERGKADWRRYNAAKDDQRGTIEKADQAVNQRSLERWATEEFQSVVEKAERAGYDRECALNFARERRPDLWPLVNRARPEPVRKAAPTGQAVLKAAEQRFLDDFLDVDGHGHKAAGAAQEAPGRPEQVGLNKSDGPEQDGGFLDLEIDLDELLEEFA